MTDVDGVTLSVQLEASAKRLENEMKRARVFTNQQLAQIERRAQQSATNISGALAGMGKAFVAGLSIGAAREAISQISRMTKEVANIANEAARAGVGTDAFQEMGYIAQQSRVGIDALTDGIKELNIRADEFITTGKGSGEEAFKRLGYSAEELKQKINDPIALLADITDRVRTLDKAAQTRIFDEIFGGTGGEQMVALIDRGGEGIRQMQADANDLGRVMDKDIIAKAEEIDQLYNQIANSLGSSVKAQIIEIVHLMAQWIGQLQEVENMTTRQLQTRIANTQVELAEAIQRRDQYKDWGEKPSGWFGPGGRIGPGREYYRDAATQEDKVVATLQDNLEKYGKILGEPRHTPMAQPTVTFTPVVDPPKEKKAPGARRSGGGGSRGGRSSTERESEYDRTIESINERTAALIAETEAQGKVNPLIDDYGHTLERARTEHDLLTAATKSGLQVTPELAATIDQLAESYATAYSDAQKLGEAQDELRSVSDEFSSLGKDAMGGFIRDMKDGKSATEALSSAVSRLTDKLLDMAIDGLFSGKKGSAGILGNIFSGMFGGGSGASAGAAFTGAGIYHTGGIVGAGGLSRRVPTGVFAGAPRYHNGGIAGLKPDEVPAILQRGEAVLSRAQTAAAAAADISKGGGGSGRAPTVNVNNYGPTQPEVQASRSGDGWSIDVMIPALENAMAARAGRGHGSLGKAVTSTATGRNLRG